MRTSMPWRFKTHRLLCAATVHFIARKCSIAANEARHDRAPCADVVEQIDHRQSDAVTAQKPDCRRKGASPSPHLFDV
jgi:hypothetical protein